MEWRRSSNGRLRLVTVMNARGQRAWPASPGRMSPHSVRPPIRAVTFDVGGTLIEVWPSVGHVYAEVAARHGVNGLSPQLLNRRFAAAWRAAENFNHSRRGWAQLVDASFRGLTERPPSQTFFDELYTRFASPEVWRIFPDVLPTLAALAGRGIKLGVISNWDERLRPLLRRLKLAGRFQTIVVSREVRAAKPAGAIFRHAVRRLGLPSEAVLHVGDSLSMDVRGARAAGFSALLLNRAATTARAGRIKSLRELG
jgi:putative hydrolase of the HAD superfamily